MKQGKKYSIKWIDTFSFTQWWDEEEIIDKCKDMQYYQETIGFYVGEWSGFIVMVTIYNKDTNFKSWGHPEWIPKGCIKKIKLLK